MLTLNDGRADLWQWDTGRALAVDADCSQVHFSNKVFGRSIDVDVTDGVAIIPDILLQTDKDLNVWAFVGTAENGYTKISKTFRVNRRNKPADYVFTPVEQTTIAEIYAIAQSVRDDADAGLFDGKPGENGRDGVDGKDGAPGKDGTSATHSWNGTVLTITSASGTSSSDLKGEKGDKGNTGPAGKDGAPGADGKTPEYGVDYGTPEQIAGIAQSAAESLQPEVNQIKQDLSDLAPTGAQVGQLFRVAAISEDGKYTMGPVDMPSGEAAWKKLVDVTTEEDASKFTFTFEEVSELIVMISGIADAQRVNFYSSGITNLYHYYFLKESMESSNYLHIHKRIGGMRYMESGNFSDETPTKKSHYVLLQSTSYGILANSAEDTISNLNFGVSNLQAGAKIQIFGR